MIDRIVQPDVPADDVVEIEMEISLRPKDFAGYIGQERLKQNLKLSIDAALKRGEQLPRVMSVEKLFFAQNVTTAMSVSQARGVVLLIGKQHNLELHEFTPLQIKQAVTGYGRADKKQIQEMVRAILGLQTIPKPDDAADALAAAIACGQSR